MKVLLLGSTGLLGQNVSRELVVRGHQVVVLVRHSVDWSFLPSGASLCAVRGSLLCYDDLRRAAEGCDAVINCAGTTDMSLLRYADYLPVNADLCADLVRLMDDCNIRSLVHVSTANTIGYGTADALANEQSPMMPPFSQSFYARSKAEGEQTLIDAAQQRPDSHIVIVNPGFIIGAYDLKPSSGQLLLASYRRPLMFVPQGGKSFVAATAAAAAIVNALTMGQHGHRYLLTGENLSLRAFYFRQAKACGYRQRLIAIPRWLALAAGRMGDLLRLCGIKTQLSSNNIRQLQVSEYYDNALAQSDLQLPSTPIEQAITQFFDWYTKREAKKA